MSVNISREIAIGRLGEFLYLDEAPGACLALEGIGKAADFKHQVARFLKWRAKQPKPKPRRVHYWQFRKPVD